MTNCAHMSGPINFAYNLWGFCTVVFIFLVLTLITIVGNLLVFVALFRFTRLRSVPNLLIGNLALSDFLLAVTILPFSALTDATGYWLFGPILCDIWLALDVLYCTASVWGLVAIAFDRFTATTFPVWYRSRHTKLRVLLYLIFVWVLSSLICLPGLLGWGSKEAATVLSIEKNNHTPARAVGLSLSTNTHVYNPVTGHYECVLFTEKYYVLYSATGSFILPLLIMLILYTKIFIVLRARSRVLLKNGNKHKRSMYNKGEKSMVTELESVIPVSKSQMDECDTKRTLFCCGFLIRVHPAGKREDNTAHKELISGIRSPNCDPHFSSDILQNFGGESYEAMTGTHGLSAFRSSKSRINTEESSQLVLHSEKSTAQGNDVNVERKEETSEETRSATVEGLCFNGQSSLNSIPIDRLRDYANSAEGLESSVYAENRTSESSDILKGVKETEAGLVQTKRSIKNSALGITRQKDSPLCAKNPQKLQVDFDTSDPPTTEEIRQLPENVEEQRQKNRKSRKADGSTNNKLKEREMARADYRERRATKRMGLIICIFVLCWIPFTLMYLIRGLCDEEACPEILDLRKFVTWLGYANSTLNPILYALFNAQFRRAFFIILHWDKVSQIRKNEQS